MTHDLVTLIKEAPEAFLDEIQDWLALVHDVGISQSALHENIWDCGLTYKMLQKAAAERDDEAQREWKAEMQQNWIARQCVVLDETSKDEKTLFHSYGQALAGHQAVIPADFV
jgi:hypothetical protein